MRVQEAVQKRKREEVVERREESQETV